MYSSPPDGLYKFQFMTDEERRNLPAEDRKKLLDSCANYIGPIDGATVGRAMEDQCRQMELDSEEACRKLDALMAKFDAQLPATKSTTTPIPKEIQLWEGLTIEERKQLSPAAQKKMKAILDANKPSVAPPIPSSGHVWM
jgi:hypothetical protein